LTPTNGTSHAIANALAADTPTRSAPISPGPIVHATASMRSSSTPASTIVRAITGLSTSACRSTWVDTTLDTTS
jgi:hypothetical protein